MTTLTLPYKDFMALVAPVIPMVAPTTSYGALEGVRIRTRNGQVVAEAVSAQMMGMCVRDHADAPDGFDIVFPVRDLPTRPTMFTHIGLEATTKGTVIVEWSGGGTALTEYDVLDPAMFPNLAKKLTQALQLEDRCGTAHLSADQLKAFAIAAEPSNNLHRAPLMVHTTRTVYDPILVTCGSHFAGLATAQPILEPHGRSIHHHKAQQNPVNPVPFWIDQLAEGAP